MPSLALTGNIGSGKTSALDLIVSLIKEVHLPVIRFSADEENLRLLEHDPDVKDRIISLLGAETYTPDGKPDREFISQPLSPSPRQKKNWKKSYIHDWSKSGSPWLSSTTLRQMLSLLPKSPSSTKKDLIVFLTRYWWSLALNPSGRIGS